MTLTSYVEAVKQVEIPLALGIGSVVFQEHDRVRVLLPGSLVIMSGLILLHLGS